MSKTPHSADVLDETRDLMWNSDFIELMAKRWKLVDVKLMLDVGCGMGHWGQMLARFLSEDAKIIGIDPEAIWIEKAKTRISNISVRCQIDYLVGFAEKIPFPDNYFDMVTCQTVLMHVKDVSQAIKEMKRVLKPNGLFAVAEPDNFGFSFNTLNVNDSAEEIIDQLQFSLTCLRGRQQLNQGNFSIGSILPYYLYQADMQDIQVYVNDLASSFVPPYKTARERSLIEKLKSMENENWEKITDEALSNFLAGGGIHSDFEKILENGKLTRMKILDAILEKKYSTSGGVAMYLISGRK